MTALPVRIQLWPVIRLPIVRYSKPALVLPVFGELKLPELGGTPGAMVGKPVNVKLRLVRFIGCAELRPRASMVIRLFWSKLFPGAAAASCASV